ncbi:MAG TPA: hypothetical protein VG734_17510 [Lacunisphaera sp.]|nr:hypothetical protein [Lacunisphaera sp.]
MKINLPAEWPENQPPPGLNAAFFLKRLDTWNQYDKRLRETFLQRLSRVLKAKGYPGRMELIENATAAERGLPIMVIDLARWNANVRTSKDILAPFECEFKATLVTPQTSIFLAAVDYSDPFGRDIERSTDVAIAEFHARMVEYVKLGLLPGPG